MDLTVHQKLESIREDIESREGKKIRENIRKHKGDLYDFLGLDFAVKAIYQDKSNKNRDHSEEKFKKRFSEVKRMQHLRENKSSKGSIIRKEDSKDKQEYEKNFTNDEIREQYFENIPNI